MSCDYLGTGSSFHQMWAAEERQTPRTFCLWGWDRPQGISAVKQNETKLILMYHVSQK